MNKVLLVGFFALLSVGVCFGQNSITLSDLIGTWVFNGNNGAYGRYIIFADGTFELESGENPGGGFYIGKQRGKIIVTNTEIIFIPTSRAGPYRFVPDESDFENYNESEQALYQYKAQYNSNKSFIINDCVFIKRE